ncbi:hypothetical protein R6Z07F_007140 [Ovis aries]
MPLQNNAEKANGSSYGFSAQKVKSRREPQLRAPDFATPQLGVPPSGAAELAEKKALRHPAGQEESVSDSTPSAEVQGVSARAGATRDYAVRRDLLSREILVLGEAKDLKVGIRAKDLLGDQNHGSYGQTSVTTRHLLPELQFYLVMAFWP